MDDEWRLIIYVCLFAVVTGSFFLALANKPVEKEGVVWEIEEAGDNTVLTVETDGTLSRYVVDNEFVGNVESGDYIVFHYSSIENRIVSVEDVVKGGD